jgi:predicted permease
MGIPLIGKVLGDGATIYASVYNITFNLFLWSFGVYLCTEGRDHDGDSDVDADDKRLARAKLIASLKKALLHPVTLAAAVGLFFFFLPIDQFIIIPEEGFEPDSVGAFLSGLFGETFTMLKKLVVPLSMTVIGLRLADISFRGVFKDKDMYVFLALRHLVLPAIVFAVMRLLSLTGIGITTDVVLVVLIMACAPTASSATMFAERYDCDAAYVSKLVAISTILSIATMPLVILLSYI